MSRYQTLIGAQLFYSTRGDENVILFRQIFKENVDKLVLLGVWKRCPKIFAHYAKYVTFSVGVFCSETYPTLNCSQVWNIWCNLYTPCNTWTLALLIHLRPMAPSNISKYIGPKRTVAASWHC